MRGSRRILTCRKARPFLSMVGVSLDALADEIRLQHFPSLPKTPPIFFVDCKALACIYDSDTPDKAVIFLHHILNESFVPEFVFTWILRHEMLHTEIKSRKVDGKFTNHPPEFFERERVISPEKDTAFGWVKEHTYPYLVRKEDGLEIKPGWKKPLRKRDKMWELLPPKKAQATSSDKLNNSLRIQAARPLF